MNWYDCREIHVDRWRNDLRLEECSADAEIGNFFYNIKLDPDYEQSLFTVSITVMPESWDEEEVQDPRDDIYSRDFVTEAAALSHWTELIANIEIIAMERTL